MKAVNFSKDVDKAAWETFDRVVKTEKLIASYQQMLEMETKRRAYLARRTELLNKAREVATELEDLAGEFSDVA